LPGDVAKNAPVAWLRAASTMGCSFQTAKIYAEIIAATMKSKMEMTMFLTLEHFYPVPMGLLSSYQATLDRQKKRTLPE